MNVRGRSGMHAVGRMLIVTSFVMLAVGIALTVQLHAALGGGIVAFGVAWSLGISGFPAAAGTSVLRLAREFGDSTPEVRHAG